MAKVEETRHIGLWELQTVTGESVGQSIGSAEETSKRVEDFIRCQPKHRSDLANAAGFAALACVLFRFSLIPWFFELASGEAISGVVFLLLLPLPGLPAPLALWLGIRAWSELKRHPGETGRAPATIGLIIGCLGTLIFLFETYQVVKALPNVEL